MLSLTVCGREFPNDELWDALKNALFFVCNFILTIFLMQICRKRSVRGWCFSRLPLYPLDARVRSPLSAISTASHLPLLWQPAAWQAAILSPLRHQLRIEWMEAGAVWAVVAVLVAPSRQCLYQAYTDLVTISEAPPVYRRHYSIIGTLYTKSIHQHKISPFSLLEVANFKCS